jgi:hypothetical protein
MVDPETRPHPADRRRRVSVGGDGRTDGAVTCRHRRVSTLVVGDDADDDADETAGGHDGSSR